MSFADKLKSGIAKLAAIGSVKRKGIGGLQAYGGKVEGEGHVISCQDGSKTEFTLSGQAGQR